MLVGKKSTYVLMKQMAICDPVVKISPHMCGKSSLNHVLSFIYMMKFAVRQSLLRIRKPKYFGLLFDSTSNQAHYEQVRENIK